jgi:SAM-dependent methyltransferase
MENASLKSALRGVVMAVLPDAWGNRLMTAKHALWWRTVERHWHLRHFAQDDSKEWLKVVLSRVRNDTGLSFPTILEFGCNAGNNLYRLRQDPATAGITYYGIDINPKAIAFAKANFPSDFFRVGDHKSFIKHADSLGAFDVFVASGVLCYIDEKHTRLVLEAAHRIADYIVVVDHGERIFEARGDRAGLFTHPYANILQRLGSQRSRNESHTGERQPIRVLPCAHRSRTVQ